MSDTTDTGHPYGLPPPAFSPGEKVDLHNCHREPIHIPGSIQAHGVLLVLDADTWEILQTSTNSEAWLGQPADALIGQRLENLITEASLSRLQRGTQYRHPLDATPITVHLRPDTQSARRPGGETPPLLAMIHTYDTHHLLELEAPADELPQSVPILGQQAILAQLQRTGKVGELFSQTVTLMRQYTGYDRVMLYRFDAQWNGQVVAEARRADLEPFLHLFYPATDIPAQARALYHRNLLRLIPDINYTPVPIEPTENPRTRAPVDLSDVRLRSVSPIHIEYLQNMGVEATLTLSILVDDRLWGLIACHHYSPLHLPHDVREQALCTAQLFSLQLSKLNLREELAYRNRIKDRLRRMVLRLPTESENIQTLLTDAPNVCELFEATGAALFYEGEWVITGEVPGESLLEALKTWLQEEVQDEIYATHNLPQRFEPATACKDVASGLLALWLDTDLCLMIFRPEVVHTVNWAGDPDKSVEVQPDSGRLSPRKSFAQWKETVRQTARPWQAVELELAHELRAEIRNHLGQLVQRFMKQTAEMQRLSDAVQQSQKELDDFAYFISHDMKEPLRGLHNYANFLQEDYADKLDEEGRFMLQSLGRLTRRMDEMINGLLEFSRLGRLQLSFEAVDLNTLLAEVRDELYSRLQEKQAEIRIPEPLPTVLGDPNLLKAVFTNLMVNAVKYNDKAAPWIELGCLPESQTAPHADQPRLTLYVRDNGVGIEADKLESIFIIFRRLQAREQSDEEGLGMGLTFVKRIIQRHRGTVWAESEPGVGTIFYFTLQRATASES